MKKDVAVYINDELVCLGDVAYAADMLGYSVSTVCDWMESKRAEPWGVRIEYLDPLVQLWSVNGGVPVTIEEAATVLHCSPEKIARRSFSRSGRSRRYERKRWALPPARIQQMLEAARCGISIPPVVFPNVLSEPRV